MHILFPEEYFLSNKFRLFTALLILSQCRSLFDAARARWMYALQKRTHHNISSLLYLRTSMSTFQQTAETWVSRRLDVKRWSLRGITKWWKRCWKTSALDSNWIKIIFRSGTSFSHYVCMYKRASASYNRVNSQFSAQWKLT